MLTRTGYVLKKSAEHLVRHASDFWSEWIGERDFADLSDEHASLFRKSLMYMRAHVDVDGGVIDNFPVRLMRRQGRGTTIGIDIDTGGTLSAGAGVEDSWSAWEFFRRLVWKRKETLPIPSIVRILLRSALIASAARAMEDRAAADLLIVPPMTSYDLLDWTSFDAAIEVGYRSTMEALDAARTLPTGARLFVA